MTALECSRLLQAISASIVSALRRFPKKIFYPEFVLKRLGRPRFGLDILPSSFDKKLIGNLRLKGSLIACEYVINRSRIRKLYCFSEIRWPGRNFPYLGLGLRLAIRVRT